MPPNCWFNAPAIAGPLRFGAFLSSNGFKPKKTMPRSEEHTSELQSPCNLVCRLLLEKKKKIKRVRRVVVGEYIIAAAGFRVSRAASGGWYSKEQLMRVSCTVARDHVTRVVALWSDRH